MKIINKIKAFFAKENEPVELDLIAAEIKEGRAFLHTKGEVETTYLIRSNDIRILLNEGKSLSAGDIYSITQKKKLGIKPRIQDKKEKGAAEPEDHGDASEGATRSSKSQQNFHFPGFEKYKKRVFSVSLYPEEYDSLIDSMKEYGYKRADFLLACVQSAKKTSMEKAHKEIIKTHKQMLVEQKELIAQQIAELDNSIPAM